MSSTAAKLRSPMLAFACASFFAVFLWLTFTVDAHTFYVAKERAPLVKNTLSIFHSTWAEAIAVGDMNVVTPVVGALSGQGAQTSTEELRQERHRERERRPVYGWSVGS
eukprot:877098-Pyramimonas_sp.AAC.1